MMVTPHTLADLPAWRRPLLNHPEGSVTRQIGERLRNLHTSRATHQIDQPTFERLAREIADELEFSDAEMPAAEYHVAVADIGRQYLDFAEQAHPGTPRASAAVRKEATLAMMNRLQDGVSAEEVAEDIVQRYHLSHPHDLAELRGCAARDWLIPRVLSHLDVQLALAETLQGGATVHEAERAVAEISADHRITHPLDSAELRRVASQFVTPSALWGPSATSRDAGDGAGPAAWSPVSRTTPWMDWPASLATLSAWRKPLLRSAEGSLARQFGEQLAQLHASRADNRIDQPTFEQEANRMAEVVQAHGSELSDAHRHLIIADLRQQSRDFSAQANDLTSRATRWSRNTAADNVARAIQVADEPLEQAVRNTAERYGITHPLDFAELRAHAALTLDSVMRRPEAAPAATPGASVPTAAAIDPPSGGLQGASLHHPRPPSTATPASSSSERADTTATPLQALATPFRVAREVLSGRAFSSAARGRASPPPPPPPPPPASVSASTRSMNLPKTLEDLPAWRKPLLDSKAGTLSHQFGVRLKELHESRASHRIDQPTFETMAAQLAEDLKENENELTYWDHHLANADLGRQYRVFTGSP